LVREINGPDQLQVRTLFNDPQHLKSFRLVVSGPQKREFSVGLEVRFSYLFIILYCLSVGG
jgi:hypothetical protein